MNNVAKFIELQDKANKDINTFGETSIEVADELNRLTDLLTPEEQDEIINHYN